MRDWTSESLRRGGILASLAAVAVGFDAAWVKVAAIVAFVFFFFFLLRNPEGWIRRLSYMCTMLGAGLLVKLGSALKGTGWAIFETHDWLVGLVLELDDSSSFYGVILLGAGIVFAVIELARQHWLRQRLGADEAPATIPLFEAGDFGANIYEVRPVIAFRNTRKHELSIRGVSIGRYRLVDHVLVRDITLGQAVTLEVESGSPRQERVRVGPDNETVWGPGTWKRFEIAFRFKDRIGRPIKYLRWLYWLFGLTRRVFRVSIELREADKTLKEAFLVRL